ncbi:probable WRKY transcription factor 3 [Rutidosis leptorrhynchoides]|uniref:probable WRKY transcription factor 3 n=1 Tax=Rutidosis leptorrhynchoides TaxID=125765 RepID=UPI003A9A26CC
MNSSGGRLNMNEEMNWGMFNYFNDESFISSNQNQFLNSPSFPVNSNIISSPGSYYDLVFKEEETNVSDFKSQIRPSTSSSISGIRMELEPVKSQVVEWDVKSQVKQIDFSKDARKIEPELAQNLQTHSNLDPLQATKEQSRFEDGYNWRKYGEKQVKGSKRFRSYYKCNYPDCPTKKKVEKDLNGYITEVIYKGKHIHPMPRSTKKSLLNTFHDTILEKSRFESFTQSSLASTGEDEYDSSISKSGNDYENEPNAKRWKVDEAESESTSSIGSKSIQEAKVVIETKSEIDILDDGYKWKKYGQKVVKGNSNPRSYYKCTNIGCPVRKLVERASHDFRSVITTYEGKHNHGVPIQRGSFKNTTKQLSTLNASNTSMNYVPMTYEALPNNVGGMRWTNNDDQTHRISQTSENSRNDNFLDDFYPKQDWKRDEFLSTVKKEHENDLTFNSYLYLD